MNNFNVEKVIMKREVEGTQAVGRQRKVELIGHKLFIKIRYTLN